MLAISSNSNVEFSKKVADHLGIDLVDIQISKFSNGETRINSISESVRGKDIYVIFSISDNINDELIETFLLCHTIKHASAKSINLVVTSYPYARQDKKIEGRVPISAKCVTELFEACGVTKIITVDLHNEAIQGFSNFAMDNLTAMSIHGEKINDIIDNYSKTYNLIKSDFIIISPDAGGTKRASKVAKTLGLGLVVIEKNRKKANEVDSMILLGDVENKIAFIIDDMVDTCGTLKKAVVTLKDNGAREVFAFATHAPLSGNALKNIDDAPLTALYVTDSVNLCDKEKKCKKIKVLTISKLIASSIYRHYNNDSLSETFKLSEKDIDLELEIIREKNKKGLKKVSSYGIMKDSDGNHLNYIY